jgi:serine-type D-Ala-D-Ala carboxypeptidase/endopeptidase (penicillin-binding protein 4)
VRRTQVIATFVAATFLIPAASPEAAASRWERKLHELTRFESMSIKVTAGRETIFDKRSGWKRIPASNQKLLLSMALLDRLGPEATFSTRALVSPKPAPLVDAGEPYIDEKGVLHSNVWIVGTGDPTLSNLGGGYGGFLSIKPTWMYELAGAIQRAGVKRIAGRVVGVKEFPFHHDWNAPGWKPEFNEEQVALPSALSVDGNVKDEHFTSRPELQAARSLTKLLEKKKIWVKRSARAWKKGSDLTRLTEVHSPNLSALLGHMNRTSSNFFAEVLGKGLAVATTGRRGTIERGAGVLRRWVRKRDVGIEAYDGSGLSFANRVSARGIVRLLKLAGSEPWGDKLFHSLPKGGWGTLEDRLHDVRLRAKTGTLENVSALSGWLWLRRTERWARFSILTTGMSAWRAKGYEDRIVRLLAQHF